MHGEIFTLETLNRDGTDSEFVDSEKVSEKSSESMLEAGGFE